MPRSRMMVSASQAHRPPRQAKAGLPPGKGAMAGAMGQPPFEATDAQRSEVVHLVACGFTIESISVIMAIPQATLERHFRHELSHGKLLIDAKILTGISRSAVEGDKTMSIFWARARAGWKHAGEADAQPGVAFAININNDSAPPDSHTIRITALPGTTDQSDEP